MAANPLDPQVRKISELMDGKNPTAETAATDGGGMLARFMKFMSENYADWFKDNSAKDQKPFPAKGGS